jgi:pimeloyl-ACP methyl ester carboxylesterase
VSLVLLPGLDGTGSLLRPLVDELGDMQARVITYPPHQALKLGELSALVLRQLPASKVTIVAESFSGLVALSLLTSAAARISGVIFVGAFAEPPRPLLLRLSPLASRSPGLLRSSPAFLLRQFCLGAEATTRDLASLREALAAVSPAVLAQRLALVASRHAFAKSFDVPSCYLRARQDRLVPAHAVKWFSSRFRNFELAEIDGPHFLLMMKPGEAARAITQQVRRMAGLL